MAFNVNEFKSQVNKRGLAVNNLFVLTITPPKNFADNMDTRDLTFFCSSVQIPSFSLNTQGVRTLGYGPTISYPMSMEHDTLSAIFMVDHQMEVKKFFHRWQQEIYNYNSEQGPLATNNNQMVYELNYKKNYSATIEVKVYSAHDEQNVYVYKFFDAWPVVVNNSQYAWENAAEVMRLPIQFRYSRMTNDGLSKNSVDVGVGSTEFGYSSALGSVGSLINNVASIQGLVNNFASQITNVFRL